MKSEDKRLIIVLLFLLAIFVALMVDSYVQMHYDKNASAYVLSEKTFKKFAEFSDETFANYEEKGDYSSDSYVLSQAKLLLDEYMSSKMPVDASCIEWAVESGSRYGVQYTWKTENMYYSKIFPCDYDVGTYPTLKVVNDELVQVSTIVVRPG